MSKNHLSVVTTRADCAYYSMGWWVQPRFLALSSYLFWETGEVWSDRLAHRSDDWSHLQTSNDGVFIETQVDKVSPSQTLARLDRRWKQLDCSCMCCSKQSFVTIPATTPVWCYDANYPIRARAWCELACESWGTAAGQKPGHSAAGSASGWKMGFE